MTDRQRLDLLWNNHHAHVDEHRYLSKRIDRLEKKIKHLIKILENQLPPIEINIPEGVL